MREIGDTLKDPLDRVRSEGGTSSSPLEINSIGVD